MKNNLHRTGKYLIIIGFFLLVVNVTLGIILTRQSSNAIRTMIRNRMLDISNTAAAMLDGDSLEVLEVGDKDTPEYQEVLRILTYYQDNIDLKYIYCIRDMGNKKFVFTVDPTIDDPGEFGEPIVYTDALYRASLGEPSVDSEPYEDDWGRFYSAYSPVFNSKHEVAGIVAVDFSADWYDRQISNQIRTTLIITIVSLTFGALLVLMIASRFSKRFKLLYNELNDLSDGIESLADELSTAPSKDKTKDRVHKSKESDEEKAQDDISAISNKIRDLQEDLSRQISIVKGQAYIDGLTGLENRTSYMECLKLLEEQIEKGTADFTVAMFDINGLKAINDVKGHEVGDKAIKEAARILKKVFDDDRLFRIGGDEFVVILKCDEEGIKEHFGLFSKMLEESDIEKGDMPVAMSKGYAIYDKEKDKTYKDTFSRADDAMYADKKAYYMTHEDRRKK